MSLEIKKIKLKNSLANHVLINSLIEALVDYIKNNIPKYLDLKLNNELTQSACKVVDKIILNDKTLSEKQKNKILKELIVIEAFKVLFNLNDDEVQLIESQIEFLVDNKLIKSKSIFQKVIKGTSKFLKKVL